MPVADLQDREGLSPEAVEYLHLLMGEWQILADLGFGDVHLIVPEDCTASVDGGARMPKQGSRFVVLGHVRPGTAVTLFPRDQIGQHLDDPLAGVLRACWLAAEPTLHRNTDLRLLSTLPGSVQALVTTLVFRGEPIAQLSLITDRQQGRSPAASEEVYREIAADLLRMARTCSWPQQGTQPSPRRGNPRVGDGLIRLREDDRVSFMSPNAASAVARIGAGETALGQILTSSIGPGQGPGEQVDEELMGVLRGRIPSHAEVQRGRSAVMFRSIPLSDEAGRLGAVLLCRDVSELRRRERELSSKDAAIRETHHRVKNSLQAVSALMRMQYRRSASEDTRRGLSEAMRRLEAVSMVHETLSHTPEDAVDFDQHFARQIRAIAELAATGQRVETRLEGSFGELPGHQVTPMALVLNEVLTNAVEHGLRGRDGTLCVSAHRRAADPGLGSSRGESSPQPTAELVVTVTDDGVGMDPQRSVGRWSVGSDDASPKPAGLGSQIVRNLVLGELDGAFSWRPGPEGGTVVELTVPVYASER